MENPRADKVAVVDEVRQRFEEADAVVVTEYRGLTVGELSALRGAMRGAGGEYRVYKNTLVRFATRSLELDLDDQLTGPTALAFVSTKADGTSGDIAAVAKALTDFAKGNPLLVIKGGVLGSDVLDAAGAKALASMPTAAEIYARIAGGLNSGARGLAGAISGVHRSIAYVLQAAIDAGAFSGDTSAPSAAADEQPAAEPTTEEPVTDAAAEDAVTDEADASAADTPEAAAEAPVDAQPESDAEATEES